MQPARKSHACLTQMHLPVSAGLRLAPIAPAHALSSLRMDAAAAPLERPSTSDAEYPYSFGALQPHATYRPTCLSAQASTDVLSRPPRVLQMVGCGSARRSYALPTRARCRPV